VLVDGGMAWHGMVGWDVNILNLLDLSVFIVVVGVFNIYSNFIIFWRFFGVF
jgi:hypothetical protein